MKPIEIAESKSEDLYQKLTNEIGREVAKLRSEANLAGALHSSRVYALIREICSNKMKELQKQMVAIYVETLGHKLQKEPSKTAIAKKVWLLYERCNTTYFGLNQNRLLVESSATAFLKDAEALLKHLDQELDIAIHEAKKLAPGFWEKKKDDIWLLVIGAIIGCGGTLLAQWITRLLQWQTP